MIILQETYQRLLKQSDTPYIRHWYSKFSLPQQVVGIVGARGVGKTTFLLHYLRKNYMHSNQGLYVSADHLYFKEHTLLGLADQFIKEHDGKLLCIDEIHKYPNWNQELKNIVDSYPDLRVIFSGSSSIDLMKGKYDLSRRVYLTHLYGFSFREYLEYKTKLSLPILDLKDIIDDRVVLSQEFMHIPKLLGHFKTYLKYGYYPTFTQISDKLAYQQSLLNIFDKVVFEDISSFYNLKTANLDNIKKVVYFIATMQPGKVNINRLSQSIGNDHTTTAGYIQMLRDSNLLRFLLNDKYGHTLVRNAEKIYLDNTNLLFAINNVIGKDVKAGQVRGIFALSNIQNRGIKTSYTVSGDFVAGDYVLEIGGKNKDTSQVFEKKNGYVFSDDILVAGVKTIPLYLLGFLN